MWSDNETDLDLLNVKHLADAITDLSSDESLLPMTIGIFGGWGSGKSSLVKILNDRLSKEDGTLCIYFNGWQFEGYEDAKSAILGDIISEIADSRTLTKKGIAFISKLTKRINWMGVLQTLKYGAAYATGDPTIQAAMISADLGPVIEQVKRIDPKEIEKGIEEFDVDKMIKEAPEDYNNIRKNIRDFRKDFSELLEETKVKRLVIFIDDLDRCLPDTVVETLEALKLFLSVPNTVFIIAADQYLIEKAIERKFPNFKDGSNEVCHDYLEKLIQMPIIIPPLSRTNVFNYINLLFAQLHLKEDFKELYKKIDFNDRNLSINYKWIESNIDKDKCSKELKEDLALAQQIGGYLSEMLKGNPRQIKRFLNNLLLRINIAASVNISVKKNILAKLMVLEYKYPEYLIELANWQNEQNGCLKKIKYLEEIDKIKKEIKKASDGAAKNKIDNSGYGESLGQWINNPWLVEWIKSEPLLSEVDLESYFYVVRERTGIIVGRKITLSENAVKFIEKLFSISDVDRVKAINSSNDLLIQDLLDIFEVIKEKINASDKLKGKDSELNILIDLAKERNELVENTLSLLADIAEPRLGAGIAPKVAYLKGISPDYDKRIDALLEKWNKSENLSLAKAADTILTR